jgi:signal peptidase I
MEIIPPKNQAAPQPAYQRPPDYEPGSIRPSPTPSPQRPNRFDSLRSALSTIGLFASAFLIAILLNTFVIQSYQVDGESMEPTLQNNDRLIVDKVPRTLARIDGHQYVPKRGDIIIFNIDSIPGFVGQKQLIKRVIGLPGERVIVKDGHITVYNPQHPQGFNPDAAGTYTPNQPTTNDVDISLSNDQLFVCGDNRPNSEDSRYFGPINTNQVVAKLVLRILPVSNVKHY